MIVHSIDKKQQTTKLDRIGVCAKTRKDMVFDNLGHAIDLGLLYQSYQQLDERKAVGCDGVTKEAYKEELGENLKNLLVRIRKGAYKPKPARVVEIPKEDGSTRPLAISCFEDKIVQQAVNSILTKVFEPQFLPCSYGYREGMNCHEALRALMRHSNQNANGAVVEIDLRKYFNSIPHAELMKILEGKISDKRFLSLIRRLIRTPTLQDGKAVVNKVGCPQGSIISPVLSNVYLHHVIDTWFDTIKRTHLRGRAEEVRFADDMVFVFQYREDAEKFYRVLPKRLQKFGLALHTEKSSVIRSGGIAAEEAARKKERLPSYKFLGFTCYWGKSRKGFWRLKYKSRSDRITAKLKGLRKYLKENLNQPTDAVIMRVIRVVKGWGNYHAISDNQRCVSSFIMRSERILFWWVNRKGGKRKRNWEKFILGLRRLKFPASFKTTSMFSDAPK
jgi:group II intron reverse transcriptase/maturase